MIFGNDRELLELVKMHWRVYILDEHVTRHSCGGYLVLNEYIHRQSIED